MIGVTGRTLALVKLTLKRSQDTSEEYVISDPLEDAEAATAASACSPGGAQRIARQAHHERVRHRMISTTIETDTGKKRFAVEVTRIAYSTKTIEVEADGPELAEALAVGQAPNEVFPNEHTSEYEAQGSRELN
ncbi:MAG: hypothetical protein LC800_20695 [Acidobacteria bacterium]|nr:hypothetical protein [Acidobacteriota bacterium]